MKTEDVEKVKDTISNLVDQFHSGLKDVGLGHLKIDAIHFSKGSAEAAFGGPKVCYIDDEGRRVCFPPEH